MAHFALIENGVVTQIIVATQLHIMGLPNSEDWIQASYNTRKGVHYLPNSDTPSPDQGKALRKNYPGVGYTYDRTRDAFIPPKPHPSWVLNEFTCWWEAPVPCPPVDLEKQIVYVWDEPTLNWVLLPPPPAAEPNGD